MIFNCRKNHGESEFFEESRLVFRNTKRKIEFHTGKEEGKKNPTSKRLADAKKRVEKWREERKKKKSSPDFRSRYDERDLKREKGASSEKSKRAINEKLKFRGFLQPKELSNMVTLHHSISAQLMNPSFMMYIRTHYTEGKKLNADEIIDTMLLVVKNPEGFKYRYNKKTGEAIITEKKLGKNRKKLKLSSMSGKKFNVIEVNGKPIKGAKDKLPWENVGHVKRMKHFDDSYWNDFDKIMDPKIEVIRANHSAAITKDPSAAGTIKARKDYDDAMDKAEIESEIEIGKDKSKREIFLYNNVTLPLRFIKVVEARNYKWEKEHGGVEDLIKYKVKLEELDAMIKAGKSDDAFTQIQSNPDTDYVAWTTPHTLDESDYMRDNAYLLGSDGRDAEICIHKDGYIMDKDKNGDWQIDPRYGAEVKRRYYDKAKKKPGIVKMTEKNPQAYATKVKKIDAEAKEIDRRRANLDYAQSTIEDLSVAPFNKFMDAMAVMGYMDRATANNPSMTPFDKFMDAVVTMGYIDRATADRYTAAGAVPANYSWSMDIIDYYIPDFMPDFIEDMTDNKSNTDKIKAAIA